MILESGGESHESGHGEHAVAHVEGENGVHDDGDHKKGHAEEHSELDHAVASHGDSHAHGSANSVSALEHLATDDTNTGVKDELAARDRQRDVAGVSVNDTESIEATIESTEEDFLVPSRAGVFFSIYYCMTGVHAIHILVVSVFWFGCSFAQFDKISTDSTSGQSIM